MNGIDPDLVTLEVEQWGSGVARQLCRNPNGERGAFWWTTPFPTATIGRVDASEWGHPHALAYTSTGSGPQSWRSIMFPCDHALGLRPFGYVTRVFAAQDLTVFFSGYDDLGDLVGTTANITIPAGAGSSVRTLNPTGLPAGTKQVRLTITWTGAEAGTQAILTDFKLTAATSLPAPAAIHSANWVAVDAVASEIDCTSAGLEPGTLTAVLHNAWVDPANGGLFEPGAGLRVSVGGLRLWTGEVAKANTEYHKVRRTGVVRQPTITVRGVNAITRLAATPSPRGTTAGVVGGAQFMVEDAGVPWEINGSTVHHGESAVIYPNPGASALDQVILWRDYPHPSPFRAWVNRFGVLVLTTAVESSYATYSDAPAASLSYVDIDATFDPAESINTVTVIVGNGDEATEFGPYTDAASVHRWGAHHGTWRVYGNPAGSGSLARTVATRVLASNATPTVRVKSIGLNVSTGHEMDRAAGLESTRILTVVSAGKTYLCRIESVTHRITAHRDAHRPALWHTTVTLAPAGTRPPPLQAIFPK